MPSTRRAFVVSAAAFLAGCAGARQPTETPEETPSGSPTPTPTGGSAASTHEFGESATVGELTVRPYDATVQHSYVTLVYPDFADVVAPDGRQFLFLTVEVGESRGDSAPDPGDFSVVSGETAARGRNRGESGRPYREGRAYTPDHGEGWILFELPAPVEGDRLALELDHGDDGTAAWTLPDGVTARLRAPPPEFEVREFEAPSTVRPDEPIEVSATVANVGDGAGTFHGSLNQEGDALYAAAPFSFDLDPGEEREWTETVTTHQHGKLDSELSVRLRFRSAGGDFGRNVVVRPAATTTG